jgi:hypothetical protein
LQRGSASAPNDIGTTNRNRDSNARSQAGGQRISDSPSAHSVAGPRGMRPRPTATTT